MSPRSVLRGKLGRRGAAVDVDVKDSDRQTEDGNASLEKLFVEMEEHMALDRIIEARAVVDRIRSSPFYVSSSRVSPQRERRILHIVRESDHITDMLRDLQTDDGWTFANERRGVTVHYRHHDGSAVHTVKTHTILENYGPKEFLYLISLFLEADLMWKWFPNKVVQSVQLLAEPTKYHKILLSHVNLHLPMVADREMLAEGIGYHLGDQNAMLCYTKTIESSPFCDIPPPKKNRVRMESQVIFFFQLLPGDRVRFCQISHDNLKIRFMPAFLLNFLAQGVIPMEFIHQFKKTVKNIKGTEWDRRVNVEKRELYREIETRIHEELKALNRGTGKQKEMEPKKEQPRARKNLSDSNDGESKISSAKSEGLPLWLSVSITVGVASAVRISQSVESLRVPWFVYLVVLTGTAVMMTHLTFVYEKDKIVKDR